MRFLRKRLLLAALVVVLTVTTAGQSFAFLMVAPIRVVFENRNRSAVLLLLNTDSKPHTYRITWKMMRMDENGQYIDLPLNAEDPHSVANMVVFSPRQVTIEPNGRQNIRLSLRRPADLPPGEYRAHLLFSTLPEDSKKNASKESKSAALNLKISLAVSIPIIVREGVSIGEVAIGEPYLKPADNGQQNLHVALSHTTGANSLYGRIRVFQQIDGKDEQIGILNNVALYPEQDKRLLAVPLTQSPRAGSTLRIAYEGVSEYKGKILAEKTISITQ